MDFQESVRTESFTCRISIILIFVSKTIFIEVIADCLTALAEVVLFDKKMPNSFEFK